ncbi:putative eukaryotic translation initiation factor 3 protein [Botrytis fragariae]|uniref:Putative eukaryotic translation initiation factor 3 protein n=1 Tax=Botrytis fragariae TaxID=1964551 RepID=A0A8H6AKG3_9HELO|nr:putative eukaryotic translation initiation factor 3 protein [Botrytis fragariae]KAF5868986.1 putative eukaryotic translation initiation factor 3 protein [Botrytis fragariae]
MEALKEAYLDFAMQVGQEYLLQDYQGRDLYAIWRNNTSDEKVERFKKWLGDEENESALLILDHIDGMKKSGQNPIAGVSEQAKNILLTTRNPNIHLRDGCKTIKLNNMEIDDIVTVLEEVRSLEDEDTEDFLGLNNSDVLLYVAKSVYGHPLAACIAMKYIIQVQSLDDYTSGGQDFVSMLSGSMLSGSDYKARMSFLQYKTQMPSIMDTLIVSKKRLSHPQGPAWSLMEVLSLLETDESIVDFKKFFAFSNIKNTEEFPDFDILGLRKGGVMPLLRQIEEVSFMERTRRSKPLRIQPLWAECTRQLMGKNRMLSLMKQIVTICYYSTIAVSEGSMGCNYYPHVKHCIRICGSFDISVSSLEMQKEINMLVHSLAT